MRDARQFTRAGLRRALAVAFFCVVLCASAAAAVPAPRKALLQARVRVNALATRATTGSVRRLAADAASHLKAATDVGLWINDREIDAPSYGTNVFVHSAQTVADLQKLAPSSRTALDLIVGADRHLAEGVINQASGGNHRLLLAAKQALKVGGTEAGKGRPAGAVSSYTKAWESAFEALRQLVAAKATSVPRATLIAAAENALGSKLIGLAGPMIVPRMPPLRMDGKPELFFAGSEACPFCGIERWGMIVALSQFGTFSNLHLMQSDPAERPADRGFTFFGSSYRSPYISFVPVEVLSNVRKGFAFVHLQQLTPAQKALIKAFDRPSQTPFIDVGNRFVKVESTVVPDLIAGKSWIEIANSLRNANSLSAQAISGTAEVLTAELCGVTNGHPQSVCSASVVNQYQAALPLLDGKGGGCMLSPISAASIGGWGMPPRARAARCHT